MIKQVKHSLFGKQWMRVRVSVLVVTLLLGMLTPATVHGQSNEPTRQIKHIQDVWTSLGLVLNEVESWSMNDTKLGDYYVVPGRQPDQLTPGGTQVIVTAYIYPTDELASGPFEKDYPSYLDGSAFNLYPNKGEPLTVGDNLKAAVMAYGWHSMMDTIELSDKKVYSIGRAEGKFVCGRLAVSVFMQKADTIPASDPQSAGDERINEMGRELVAPAKEWVKKVAPALQSANACEDTPPIIFLPGVAGTQLFNNQIEGIANRSELWPFTIPVTANRSNLALDGEGVKPLFPEAKIVPGEILRTQGLRCLMPELWSICVSNFYGGMISYLKGLGYKEGTDLFIFPYDWRLSNQTHYERLDSVIQTALGKNPSAKKVILLAHSMGGIIAWTYVYSTPERAAKVEAFVTMGTPYGGSPKVFYGLINGYSFGNPTVRQELMKILAQNFPAAYELLPRKPFINDKAAGKPLTLDDSYGIHYKWYTGHATGLIYDTYDLTSDNPQVLNSTLLANTKQFYSKVGNWGEKKDLPGGVKQYVIIGYGISTLDGYDLENWEPGLLNFWPFTSSYLELANGRKVVLRPKANEGDGTVPFWSLQSPTATRTYYVKNAFLDSSAHGVLAENTTVQSIVGQLINHNPPDPGKYPGPQFYMDQATGVLKELEDLATFELHSDAHLRIASADGQATLGFNADGGIDESLPGTFLSMDGIEYASLTDINSSYKVQISGTTAGKFTLAVQVRNAGKTTDLLYPEVPVQKGTLAQFDINPSQIITAFPEMQVTTDDKTTTVLAKLPSRITSSTPVPTNLPPSPQAAGNASTALASTPTPPPAPTTTLPTGLIVAGGAVLLVLGLIGGGLLIAGLRTRPASRAPVRARARVAAPAARLLVISGQASYPALDLTGGPVTIGNGPGNGLIVSDPWVSAQHAQVYWAEGGWIIADLQSQSGTYLNGARVTWQYLRPGDQIQVGQTVIMFQS